MSIDQTQLKAYHILPYRIVSNEYGDYPYEGGHEDGEIVAESIEDLVEKIDDLYKKYIGDWAKGRRDERKTNGFVLSDHEVRSLQRFSFNYEHLDILDCLSRVPFNSAKYPKFGKHRIELREYPENSVELELGKQDKDRLLDHAYSYLIDAITAAEKTLIDRAAHNRLLDEAEKRRQFERLKRELGES